MVLGVDVNMVAVFLAAISYMIIGSLWYGPLFGKIWMSLSGITRGGMKKMKMTPFMSMTIGFIGSLITAYFIGVFVGLANAMTVMEGAMIGFWLWLGIAMPINAGVFLWEGKPFKLFVLNTMNYLVSAVVMASIIAAW